MSLNFKIHPDHIHIIWPQPTGDDWELVCSFDDFKILVTKFLKYYHEGLTDISDQIPDVKLNLTWGGGRAPQHVEGDYKMLYGNRSFLYQFVQDEGLFDITFTPPDFNEDNIKKLRNAFKKVCKKEWIIWMHGIAKDQIDIIKAMDDIPTKEQALRFLRKKESCGMHHRFCMPLLSLATEMLGGLISWEDDRWHQACPMWNHCRSKDYGGYYLRIVGAELEINFDDLSKVSAETMEAIQRIKNGEIDDQNQEILTLVNNRGWGN